MPFLFDDVPSIPENPSIRSLAAIGDVLSPPRDTGRTVNGRPVLNLSFALNYALGGPAPAGYHAGNLIIHVCAALMLYGVVRRTLLSPGRSTRLRKQADGLAMTVALLWGLHPLHTAAVTYIVQRAESLMGLCYLLTLYCAIRAVESTRPVRWETAAAVACVLGMATKEAMVTAPLVVALYDRAFVLRSWREALVRRGRLYAGLAGSWLVLAWLMAGSGGRGGTVGFDTGMSAWEYAQIQAVAVIRYLRLVVWPYDLVFDYGSHGDYATWAVLACAGLLGLLLAAAFMVWRRNPAAGFSGLAFFILLGPSSSVVPIASQVMAEHRMYLPLAAVFCAFVVGACWLVGRRGAPWAVTTAAALALGTVNRNETLRDPTALWRDTVAKRPDNARAHFNLGRLLAQEGRDVAAIGEFEVVVKLQPNDFEARNKLGAALLRTGRPSDAFAQLSEALRLAPDAPDVHNNLGIALAKAGRFAEAIEHLETVVRLRPESFEAKFNLGSALAQAGRVPEAIDAFEKARQISPENPNVRQMLARLRGW